jgi:hypothetical protein
MKFKVHITFRNVRNVEFKNVFHFDDTCSETCIRTMLLGIKNTAADPRGSRPWIHNVEIEDVDDVS